MANSVTDKYGLVNHNEHLVTYFPQSNRAMVFRVIGRYNSGFERIDYGLLPVDAGDVLSTYDATSTTVTVDGILPARTYATGVKFDQTDAWDSNDMWWVPYTWTDRVWHVKMCTRPGFVRTGVQIPINVSQQRFQRDEVVGGVDKDNGFGYNRGFVETVHFPEIRYGYNFGNDTNMPIRTNVEFTYGEYLIEIPSSAEFLFSILNKTSPAYWVTMPVTTTDAAITQGLRKTWGFDGFTIYPNMKRNTAIAEYNQILTSKDVVGKGVLG